MTKRVRKPMTCPDVISMIEEMSSTADILALPDDWFEDYLIDRAHVQGREVSRETVRLAIEFGRQDLLERMHWDHIKARLSEQPHGLV